MKVLRHARLYVLLAVLGVWCAPAHSQSVYRLSDTLSTASNVLTGKLPNGLRYYIRENKKPEKRMELRLAVKTGSVLEDNDQQGLAHFVEHMLFNGTKSFPKMEIVNFLERTGVRFGPHLNANTSFDETVYMLQVPTDSPAVVQKSLKIVEEWASAALFENTEIDKERGVIGEEWRLGLGAGERVNYKHYPLIFYKSQYADRLPIGKKEVIDTAAYDAVKRFYRDWYRPDLMAVVVVGDFDKAVMEKMIIERFSSLTNPVPERPRTIYSIPDHKEPLVSIAADKELPGSSVAIYFKRTGTPPVTVNDYKDHILEGLYSGMLNARLQERLQKPNPPFISGKAMNIHFVGDKLAFGMVATVKETDIVRGLEALVTEAFRIKQHGFTQTELDRQKVQQLRQVEQTFTEQGKTESRTYANEYLRHFLDEEMIPGIAVEFALYKQLLPTITIADVTTYASERMADSNRVVTVSVPEKAGVVVPTKDEIVAMLDAIGKKQLEPYVDAVSSKPLITKQPAPGKIVSQQQIKELDAWEWKLSNGATVVLKSTDFKNDEVAFIAFSPGGHSLVPDKKFVSASIAAQLASVSGVGDFDAVALQKKLSGKIVRVSPFIADLSEGFVGNASPKDLETLFQLVYLNVTAPRLDSSASGTFLSRVKSSLQSAAASPDQAFKDSAQVTLAQHHYRARPQSVALIDEVNIAESFAILKDRFADASDFNFFFVGNFSPDSLRPLVEKYLASLPSLKRKEQWKDVGMKAPKGIVVKEVFKGVEPKSSVLLSYTGKFEWNAQNRFDFSALLEVLRIKLREVLREDKSGVYGINVTGGPTFMPRKEYSIRISFGCNPTRVEELIATVVQQMDSLAAKPVDASYIDKVKQLQRRDRETNLKENNYWIGLFRTNYTNGEDPRGMLKIPERIDKLDAKAVQMAAKKYFDQKNVVKVILKPEAKN